MKKIFPVCIMIISAVFVYLGITEFGFWDSVKGPMGGFYPTLIAGILLLVGALSAVQSWKEEALKIDREELKVPLAAAAVLAGSYIFGMIGAVFLYLLIWMKGVEKAGWKQTIILVLCIGGAAWLIFSVWLGVKFPKGIIGELLF